MQKRREQLLQQLFVLKRPEADNHIAANLHCGLRSSVLRDLHNCLVLFFCCELKTDPPSAAKNLARQTSKCY